MIGWSDIRLQKVKLFIIVSSKNKDRQENYHRRRNVTINKLPRPIFPVGLRHNRSMKWLMMVFYVGKMLRGNYCEGMTRRKNNTTLSLPAITSLLRLVLILIRNAVSLLRYAGAKLIALLIIRCFTIFSVGLRHNKDMISRL